MPKLRVALDDPDLLPSEDDKARARLGPRGVADQPDTAAMTPQRAKKTPPESDIPPEHAK